MVQKVTNGWPPLFGHKDAVQKVLKVVAEFFEPIVDGNVKVDDAVQDVIVVISLERRSASYKCVKGNPQGPDIAALVILPLDNFRSHIVRAPHYFILLTLN